MDGFLGFNLSLITMWMECLFVTVLPKYCHISKHLSATLTQWTCRVVCDQTQTRTVISCPCVYLKTYYLTTELLCFYDSYSFTQQIHVIITDQKLISSIISKSSLFSFNILTAYSKGKLKSNGDKVSPCLVCRLVLRTVVFRVVATMFQSARPRLCLDWLVPLHLRLLTRGWLIALMMEAVQTSETSVNSYRSTRRYNPEDSHLRTHRCEDVKSYV
jgi:hypothetical protein